MLAPIHVLLADDHPIVLQGLTDALRAYPDIVISATLHSFADVKASYAQFSDINPIVILDLSGMGDAPVSFVQNLRRTYPQVRVIIFSSNLRIAPVFLELGVQGYVLKEEMTTVLVHAIRAVARQTVYHSPLVHEYLVRTMELDLQFKLTARELFLLDYLAQGATTLDLARHLTIDARSVQNDITKLLKKVDCSDRVQLVVWYNTIYTKKHV